MLNDMLLVKKIKDGDIKTFEYVFKVYYSPLKLFAFSITQREDVSEEIVQDLFYRIWKERGNLQIMRSLKSYLYTSVRNHALRYFNHCQVQDRHRQNVLEDAGNDGQSEVNPEDELLYRELGEIIDRTLARLPERRRQIFALHRMGGKKYKEIAEDLSVSVKTIEAEMTKAYSELKKEIERYMNFEL